MGDSFFDYGDWKIPYIGVVHSSTIIATWVMLGIITIAVYLGRRALDAPDSIGGYCARALTRLVINLIHQVTGEFNYTHTVLISTLGLFITLSTLVSLIPGVAEPTNDLNTAVALGLVSFCYTHGYAIYIRGFFAYMGDYFKPFFIMFPMNIISTFSSLISLSFRLFGNIFGGTIITHLWVGALGGSILWELMGIPINIILFLFFGIFEGLIQAFVFTMLTLTYITLTIQGAHGSDA